MNRTLLLGLCGLVLVFTPWRDARAQTATLALSPASSTIGVGDWIQVFVSGSDFDGGTDGGDFSLAWTPNLSFVGLTVESTPWDVSSVDTTSAVDGSIDSVDVFASTGTPGVSGAPFPIVRLTLRATAEGSAFVSLGPDLVGWSLDGGLLDSVAGPDAAIEVIGVPEPRIGGGLALGILLLGCLGRGRGASERRVEAADRAECPDAPGKSRTGDLLLLRRLICPLPELPGAPFVERMESWQVKAGSLLKCERVRFGWSSTTVAESSTDGSGESAAAGSPCSGGFGLRARSGFVAVVRGDSSRRGRAGASGDRSGDLVVFLDA